MLNVVVVGLGPIGLAAAKAVVADPQMKLSGLVDLAPELAGTQPVEGGPAVVADGSPALKEADVAILCTSSYFDALAPLVRQCVAARTHVVSSCEEMLWPWYRHEKLAGEIDAAARESGVALLGTGVNPGFVLDLLPAVFSSMVLEVTGVKAVRRVDASTRRKPLQEKVGATMTVEAFNARKAAGTIGHKGMAESVCMLASALGVKVPAGAVVETLEPVKADKPIPSALGTIEPGRVAGMHNVGAYSGQGISIHLDLIMSVGYPERYDSIELEGPVPLKLKVEGGTPGDTATVAALVNSARVLPKVKPGLRTMLDLGHVAAARGG